MNEIKLTDGGHILYYEDFYPVAIADKLFNLMLDKVPWKQEKTSWGTAFPRLTSYYADDGVKYEYSGVAHNSLPWPDYLAAVKQKIEGTINEKFNSLLLNFYRDGQDSIGWHADDEKELGENPVIASLSLGGERAFQIKHKKTKEKWAYTLHNGSLIVMGGTMQHHWLHSVPKTDKEVAPRINMTFRSIK